MTDLGHIGSARTDAALNFTIGENYEEASDRHDRPCPHGRFARNGRRLLREEGHVCEVEQHGHGEGQVLLRREGQGYADEHTPIVAGAATKGA